MRAAGWLALSLALVLAAAEGDMLLQARSRRRSTILFPGSPLLGNASPGPVSDPDAPLELPDNMDLNTMNLDSLSRINSVDNITAFADLFGLSLSELDFLDLSTRVGGATPAETAKMAACKPELRTVQLDLPVEANTLFYPTCVRLEQCGGCCYGPLLICRPKVTKGILLKVLKTVISEGSSSSRRGGRTRRRRETVPSYHEVEVQKHEVCECGCRVREEDCNPTIHTYYEGECSCNCKNKDEKAKCEQQSDNKYWDNDTCNCYCRRPVPCSTGELFSPVTCKCQK